MVILVYLLHSSNHEVMYINLQSTKKEQDYTAALMTSRSKSGTWTPNLISKLFRMHMMNV
jgi:hypothetical protein